MNRDKAINIKAINTRNLFAKRIKGLICNKAHSLNPDILRSVIIKSMDGRERSEGKRHSVESGRRGKAAFRNCEGRNNYRQGSSYTEVPGAVRITYKEVYVLCQW
ncbi:MAG: hypothetical protein IJL01_06490 [Synergistaceae bacterium]|nr:hypothetical protein [Synergistaceae bacterium]MBQ6112024.1 hypothetical protein [Synergistaceae bacterium]